MTSFEEQLKKNARTISLSHDEREGMRTYLAEYRAHLPMRTNGSIESKDAHTRTERARAYAFDIFKLARARALVWTVVGVTLMATSGMTYAAESAVPGDPLYGLKINVNEEIVRAFSFGAEARVMWEARRAERRLEEASQLASTGALTPERERQVAAQFERHIERVAERTSEIGRDDPVKASDMHTMLENAFSAHEAILVSIAIEEQLSAESVKSLAAKVRGVAQEFGRVQGQTEEMLSAAINGDGDASEEHGSSTKGFDTALSDYDQRILVQRMREGAEKSVRTAENRITRMSLVSARDLATSKARLAEIKKVHEQARKDYTNGDFELSYARYKAVRSVSDRLARFLDAQRNLDIDALSLDLAEELLFATGTTSDGVSRAASLVIETLDEQKATVEESISALMLEEVLKGLSAQDRAEVDRLLKRARAFVVRAALAEETGDGAEASQFYESAERTLEEVRMILLAPRTLDEYENIEIDPEEHTGSSDSAESARDGEEADDDTAAGTPVLSVAVAYVEGMHTLTGDLGTSTCVVGAEMTADLENNQLTLAITTGEDEAGCAERAGEGGAGSAFSATVEAPEDVALTQVLKNGEVIDFVLVGVDATTEQATSSDQATGTNNSTSSARREVPARGYRATSDLVGRVLDDLWGSLR